MSKKVLIIDDEKWFFEPFLERLDFEKISYDFCRNGTQGLKKLKENDYKVIVLDMKVTLGKDLIHLQGEDVPGILIFKEIRKSKPNIPVICWTVLSDEYIKSTVSELGGKYFAKGGNEDKCIKEIKKHTTWLKGEER